MSDVRTSPTTSGPSSMEDEVCHWTCCHDPHRTLCGILDQHIEQTDEDDPDCVVCNDLDWSDTCPIYGPYGCRGGE